MRRFRYQNQHKKTYQSPFISSTVGSLQNKTVLCTRGAKEVEPSRTTGSASVGVKQCVF